MKPGAGNEPSLVYHFIGEVINLSGKCELWNAPIAN